MKGRTDFRAFRAGVRQASDAATRRRAFLRPLETAMLERSGQRSPEDFETERAVCAAASFPGNRDPETGPRV